MIDNCCFMFIRLYYRSVTSIGIMSFHTCVSRPSRYKIIVKKPKALPKNKVVVWKGMQIRDLADSLNMNVPRVMNAICRVLGSNEPLSHSLEIEDVSLLTEVAKLCGRSIDLKRTETNEEVVDKDVYCRNIYDNSARLKSRPPIVTIMGHVDHGKTTLLDSLRSSRIVDSEFGGITQHIGAFKVKLSDISGKGVENADNDVVTFLDTPGHAAFSLMRSRGVRCTDIVVLVVAVDDGMMPQTLESIRYAREARVPILVVINKIDRIINTVEEIDRPNIKKVFQKIHQSLSKYGVVVEELGGDVQCIPISAIKKWNLDLLQESILALSEIINIRCDYDGPCEGVVLETKIVDHFGKVATVLLQQGTLKLGSFLVAGHSFAKVRTMKSDAGKMIVEAVPGDPIEVSGWKDVLPSAGDVVIEVNSEAKAKEVMHYRKTKVDKVKAEKDNEEYNKKMESYRASYKAYMEEGYRKGYRLWNERPELTNFVTASTFVNGVEIPQVNLIIKTDVDGSLEAIENILSIAIESCADQCSIKVAHVGVGNLSENDIRMASFTNSIVYLFNLPQSISDETTSDIDVRHFNVIYHMFDDLRDFITSKLPRTQTTAGVGEATVLQIFETRENKVKVPVLGCKCTNGLLYRDKTQFFYRLTRKSASDAETMEVIQEGLFCTSLRHLRTDVESIRKGVECGIILVDNKGDSVSVNVGDVIQCYKIVGVTQKLKWNLGFQ